MTTMIAMKVWDKRQQKRRWLFVKCLIYTLETAVEYENEPHTHTHTQKQARWRIQITLAHTVTYTRKHTNKHTHKQARWRIQKHTHANTTTRTLTQSHISKNTRQVPTVLVEWVLVVRSGLAATCWHLRKSASTLPLTGPCPQLALECKLKNKMLREKSRVDSAASVTS